ncbi:DUF5305 domain-containing protein [Natronobeatus ordinarius]|uniref:DUF5305 domain-containing protein n=1 Tax=Natronobeatus ordinarius TaxID=2963433 RepID=UPI0020CBF340|nr:DUF5305 domain-containing protein [Natronobeatus ordinarius]
MIDNPRLDLLIAKHGRWLLIVLIGVGVLSFAAAGWAVASPPPTTTETEQVGEERVATELHASATVVDGADLWEAGEVLEDQPVYLTNATPTITLHTTTAVPAEDATVVHEVSVELAADRGGDVFYEETVFQDRQDVSIEDGVATSDVDVDVTDIADRRDELQSQLAGVGSVTATVNVYVTIESRDGGWYEVEAGDEPTLSTDLELTTDAYWLEAVEPVERKEPVTVTREVEEPRNTSMIGGLAALGVGSFGAAAFVFGRREIDVEVARQRVQERRYADWISRGSMPMWIGDHQIELDSLEDVVDVAIDTGERVVHDRNRDLFAVVSDNVVYYYGARGTWSETAWPSIDLDSGSTGPSSEIPPEADGEPSMHVDEGELPDPDDEDAWHKL